MSECEPDSASQRLVKCVCVCVCVCVGGGGVCVCGGGGGGGRQSENGNDSGGAGLFTRYYHVCIINMMSAPVYRDTPTCVTLTPELH